jgi:hypothetical protein
MESITTEQRQPSESGTLRYRKSRGLTCGTCRFRKVCSLSSCIMWRYVHADILSQVRCDGNQPKCRMCELHHADCRYDKAPPMSQLVAMAKRLQEAEQAIAAMNARTELHPSESIAPHRDSNPVDVAQLSPPPFELPQSAIERVSSPREANQTEDIPAIARSWEVGTSVSSQVGGPALKDSTAPELTVDEHGSIRYYGPTSAVHEPSPAMVESGSPADVSSVTDTRHLLASHARESAIWEEFAIGNASVQTGVPRQVIAKLLHVHWTWVGPMFLWIHRSAFIRM